MQPAPLQQGGEGGSGEGEAADRVGAGGDEGHGHGGGLRHVYAIDPALESAPGLVTQPLNLKCDILVSQFVESAAWFGDPPLAPEM
jgi:hypothetical protein